METRNPIHGNSHCGSIIAGVVGYELRTPPDAPVVRLPLVLPEGQQLLADLAQQSVAISPDGTRLAYIANNQVFLRSMGEMEARAIAGSPGTTQSLSPSDPFFSPDGQWVGFYSRDDSTLKKIAVTGGAPATICKTDAVSGVSWSGNDIVFGMLAGPKGIMHVPAGGGEPEELVRLSAPHERLHGPQLIDNGRSVLFTMTRDDGPGRWDKAQIVMQSLKTGERKTLIGGTDARYLPSGHLVYALGGTVYAVPFNVSKADLQGVTPVAVIEGVMRGIGGNTGATSATARFAVSKNGTLIYVPGQQTPAARQNIIGLVDRAGKVQTLPFPPESYSTPRISPDGTQVVVGTNFGTYLGGKGSNDATIWIYDLKTNAQPKRLTFGGRNRYPIWKDNRTITFQSDREGDAGLFQQRIDGSPAQRLTKAEPGTSHIPGSWSPDGKTLVFDIVPENRESTRNGATIWTLSMGSNEMPVPFLEPNASVGRSSGTFSRDGRLLAYISNELSLGGTTFQVFVQPFPATGAKYQLPSSEGSGPVWSRDGKSLIYRSGRRLVSVDVRRPAGLSFENSTILPIEVPLGNVNLRHYDIHPDGKQFAVVLDATNPSGSNRQSRSQINVVLNWLEELRQRVPVH